MFCANAVGTFLPPMVVYKAKNLYPAWINGAPPGTKFDVTKSGWFDGQTFARWFFEVLLPQLKGDGPFAVIGDNLGSHFNQRVIQKCKEKNIRFLTLPPNSTHICQPLDVAVFAPMKRVWRSLLEEWRRESRSKGTLPKQHFPLLLNRLVEATKNQNIVSGFRATGLYPVNQDEVLKHIMQATNATLNESAEQLLGPSIVRVLQENLGIGTEQIEKRKNSRERKIMPGKPIETIDGKENEEPCPSGNEGPGPSGLNPSIGANRDLSEDVLPVTSRRGKPTARNVRQKQKRKGLEWRKSRKNDIWVCFECDEEYDEEDPHVWVECDTCGERYHLECSGIKYKTNDYWTLNLDAYVFECSDCKQLFKGC